MTTVFPWKWISSCCRVMFAVLTVCCGVFVWPGLATKAIAEPVDEAAHIRVRLLGTAALTSLRDADLPQALLAIGEATDSLPPHASQEKADAGLAPAAAGLNRQLARLRSDERFDLLYAWSMPTESRRTVRVLSSPVSNSAPPKEFARALGERPRNHSFAVAEINGVRGLFGTAWLLVQSARDTGQLRQLTAELSELSRQQVPGADYVLTLGRIVAADRPDEQLEKELQDHQAKLRRDQPVELRGNGPVPDAVIWQYGYTKYDDDPERIDFKPFPYWSGLAWQGAADYPSENLGWMMMDAAGGHAERDFTPVRRWVAPANGTLSISGNLRHWYGQGDGVRGRIVSSRGGVVGEWTSLNGMTSTVIESMNVNAWDTVDFVTDRITNPRYDRFDWPVQLKLTTDSGEVLQFDTARVSPGPSDVSVLADLVLAVACLDHEWLQPIGASMIRTLRDHGYGGASAVLQPLLQRAYAVAVAVQFPHVSPTLFTNGTSNAGLQHWVVTGGSDSNLDARGASRATWLTHEDQILHLSGAGNSALLFRYPLTGEFEFSCEAQQGGRYPTDGGLVYGGLQFMTHSDRKELTVWDADIARFVKKPHSFLRMGKGATFNRLSIKSTASGTTFAVNGHPTWQDSSLSVLSPWIGLRAFGYHVPQFRNLKLTGSPTIPREVSLIERGTMRGWQAGFFEERQPQFDSVPTSTGLDNGGLSPPAGVDWYVSDKTLHGVGRAVDDGVNPQSLLRYQRPLLDGESISYEFYYKPGQFEVHPALGRLVFLMEPRGVRLRWMTDGSNEWTGLSADHGLIEPLNRQGPKLLPLNEAEWNRVTVSLANDAVSLSLNDTPIYRRSLDRETSLQFGLYHDRRQSSRVRNVVMSGDWPQRLPAAVTADLTKLKNPVRPAADRLVLNEILGEETVSTNVLAVREHAASLPEEERYRFLAEWVLPGTSHGTFRVNGAFTSTYPGGVRGDERGGQLVSPAYDLVDTAARLKRLDEVRDHVTAFTVTDEYQIRARYALLFLVEAARGDHEAAAAACDGLLTLREKNASFRYQSLWPESVVAFRNPRSTETQRILNDLDSHLASRVLSWNQSGSIAWDHHIASLDAPRRLLQMLDTDQGSELSTAFADWVSASMRTARSCGAGCPPGEWRRSGSDAGIVGIHGIDLLYYRIPLTGDFDVECDATVGGTRSTSLMFAGVLHELHGVGLFNQGNVRVIEQIVLDPPLTKLEMWARFRIRVRNGVCTTYFDGRELSVRQLPERYDPWLAVVSRGRHQSAVRNLRISGKPVVPDVVEMVAEEELHGWLPFFDGVVGASDSAAAWRYLDDPEGRGIVGAKQPGIAGSFKESLLRYHRPIAEDAVIEYEFLYSPREVHTHPTLDRATFLLDPDGVKLHWITNGQHDQIRSDPTNLTIETANRRGPAKLPLLPDAWNQMKLVIVGDTVRIHLNGELIYERLLKSTRQRTFGLFHFADQTEVRVRNLVLRGDWPKSVPVLLDQELAEETSKFLDRERHRLKAVFSHNFVADGFPTKYFDLVASPGTRATERDDGLFHEVTATGKWTHSNVTPRFQIHGNFDVVVAFEQLSVAGLKTAAALLNCRFADEELHHHRIMRIRIPGPFQRLDASFSRIVPGGSRLFETSAYVPCEAISGRLRLAREGTTLRSLFAQGDSEVFRTIATQGMTAADSIRDGIQLTTICNGAASASVVWKSVTIHADKLTWFPPADDPRTSSIVVMNVDGTNVRKLADTPDGFTQVGSPEWSADGKTIAFDTSRGSTTTSRIYEVNTDGTKLRDSGPGCMPSYSADGKRIVFTQPGFGVGTMDTDGSKRELVERTGWSGQWSPDGKFIAWGRGGNIIVMNVETKAQTPLLVGEQATLFNYTHWNLGWSHDSRSIAFKGRNRKTKGEDIVVADIDSPDGFKVLLPSSQGVYVDFTWHPDNKRVLFAMRSPVETMSQLYTKDRTTDEPPLLLPRQPAGWNVVGCAWSRDGKQIVFAGEKIPQPVEWPLASKTAE